MVNIEKLTVPEFNKLPLIVVGESKEVRYAGEGESIIRLKPTIYSFTHNRTGEVPGTDTLRLKSIQNILPIIRSLGIDHTYREVNDQWILSDLVMQPDLPDAPAFTPDDLTAKEIAELPKAPPIEVIAKARHTGTSKHRYFQFSEYCTRSGIKIGAEETYPEPVIRFDWRNPMHHPATDERLADEILPDQVANWFINTEVARKTAQTAFNGLCEYFSKKDLDLWDICFFISEDGKRMFGEISPDCMRVRTLGNMSLDKDIWRAGGSSDTIKSKWQQMINMLEKQKDHNE